MASLKVCECSIRTENLFAIKIFSNGVGCWRHLTVLHSLHNLDNNALEESV